MRPQSADHLVLVCRSPFCTAEIHLAPLCFFCSTNAKPMFSTALDRGRSALSRSLDFHIQVRPYEKSRERQTQEFCDSFRCLPALSLEQFFQSRQASPCC